MRQVTCDASELHFGIEFRPKNLSGRPVSLQYHSISKGLGGGSRPPLEGSTAGIAALRPGNPAGGPHKWALGPWLCVPPCQVVYPFQTKPVYNRLTGKSRPSAFIAGRLSKHQME